MAASRFKTYAGYFGMVALTTWVGESKSTCFFGLELQVWDLGCIVPGLGRRA